MLGFDGLFWIREHSCGNSKGTPPRKKIDFFRALPKLPLPPPFPQFGQLVPLFLDVKNDVLARITEQRKDDYDNDVSDNCDHNSGTFDDFGVKNTENHYVIDALA